MAYMKTLHVIGYKNSGKTTLLARWVRILKEKGFTVAVLKHHGHSESLSMPDPSTDTMQFFTSGADISAVAGAGQMQIMRNDEPDFQRMKEIISYDNPDILLIEGYKKEQGDKVVLLRDQSEWAQLENVHDIRLVVGVTEASIAYSHIGSRTDEQQLDDWVLEWAREE